MSKTNQDTKAAEVSEVAEVAEPTKLKFTIKRAVTLPIMKIFANTPVYLRLDAPMFEGKLLPDDIKQGKTEGAHIVNCTNLETGEQVQIVVPKVLEAVLNETYLDDSYVGLSFEVTKQKMITGKKYHNFTVKEIEVDIS